MNDGGARPWGRRFLFCLRKTASATFAFTVIFEITTGNKTAITTCSGGKTEWPSNKQKLHWGWFWWFGWTWGCSRLGVATFDSVTFDAKTDDGLVVSWETCCCEWFDVWLDECAECGFCISIMCGIAAIDMPDISSAWWVTLGNAWLADAWLVGVLNCEKTASSSQTPKPTPICLAKIGVRNTDSCMSHATSASKIPHFKGEFLNRISADNDLPYGNKMWRYSTCFRYFSLDEMLNNVYWRISPPQ